MRKIFLVRLAFLLLATSMLSGCLWVPFDDGQRRGDSRERDRGDRHGDRHDDRHDDHRDRR